MPKPQQIKTFEVEASFETIVTFYIDAYTEEEAKALAMEYIGKEQGQQFVLDKTISKVKEC